MSDVQMVDKNIDAVLCPLTDHEREVRDHLLTNIFGNLTQRHWEGNELLNYWDVL